jgi:hypothetical protein
MFEDYYFDDPELQQALIDAGYYTDPVRTPAVMPSTVEAEPIMGIGSPAVAPMSYEEREARRIAANTPPPGTSIVGPYAGKKGLSFGDDNTFSIYDEQEVRVVDGKGNVIFSGTGVEGAKQAVAVGQSLSNDLGKNANFKIQKGENTIVDGSIGPNRYIDVAYAAPSQSGLGFLADNVLPFAASFIPGIGPIAGAALGSAVSSGLQGRSLQDALVRAAIAGGSAYAGGQLFGPATPGATPTPGGNIAGSVAGSTAGSAAGSVADDVINVIGRNLVGSTLGSTIGTGLSSVTGYKTPAEKYIQQTSTTLHPPVIDYAGVEPIDVLATRLASGSGAPFAAAFPVPVNAMLSGTLNATQPAQQNKTAEEYEELDDRYSDGYVDPETGDIVVEKYRPINPPGGFDPIAVAAATGLPIGSILDSLGPLNPPPADPALMEPETQPDDIVVTGNVPTVTQGPGLGSALAGLPSILAPMTPDPALTEKSTLEKIKDAANIANAVSVLAPIAGGILGGGGGTGGIGSGTGGGLTFTKSPLRPTLTGAGIGGRYPYTPTTYGRVGGDQETEYMFFTRDPVTGATTAAPAPITTPIANEPAAPAMIMPSGNNFAEGGEVDDDMVKHLVDYHKNGGHQGPGQVKGIGSGQEDKIPAYLSDGEYVWSAQDVSDLGDGSNREGVRRLDKMRQMVRSQAGRKDVKKIAKPQKGIDRMLKAVGGMA